MDIAEITLQAITLLFLNIWGEIFFDEFFLHEEDLIFSKCQFSEAHLSPFLSSQ